MAKFSSFGAGAGLGALEAMLGLSKKPSAQVSRQQPDWSLYEAKRRAMLEQQEAARSRGLSDEEIHKYGGDTYNPVTDRYEYRDEFNWLRHRVREICWTAR